MTWDTFDIQVTVASCYPFNQQTIMAALMSLSTS